MQKIVVIGGGSGIFNVLRGLRDTKNVKITALVSVADDGGSTGLLRDEYGFLPPGDIRKCLIALSRSPKILRDLFNYRFNKKGSVSGHSFGNLFLTALRDLTCSDERAISLAGQLLDVKGRVYPISLDKFKLCAELDNGEIVKGEKNIDIPKHDTKNKIVNVFLDRKAEIYSKAKKAILEADKIVVGPGDLYTSLVPNFLVCGVGNALKKSKAKKIFFVNLFTKDGESNGFKVGDFVKVMEKYSSIKFDSIFVHNLEFDSEVKKRYALDKSYVVENDLDNVILGDFAEGRNVIRHSPKKVARAIYRL